MDVDEPGDDPTSKRPRDNDDSDASIGSTSSVLSREKVISREKRKRGRPPTTGEYVGLAAAQAEQNRLANEELMIIAERELLENWTKPSVTRARKVLLGAEVETEQGSKEIFDPSCLTAADLEGQLRKTVEALRKVASFKKGYNGPSIGVLKEAAKVVAAAGKELAGRTQSDESCRLREANARLTGEVAELRRQLRDVYRHSILSSIRYFFYHDIKISNIKNINKISNEYFSTI